MAVATRQGKGTVFRPKNPKTPRAGKGSSRGVDNPRVSAFLGATSNQNPTPHYTIYRSFPEAVQSLEADCSWERLQPEAQELDKDDPRGRERFWEEMQRCFSRAQLSEKELRVIRLGAALEARDQSWPPKAKAERLGMTKGAYKAALIRAHAKLRGAATNDWPCRYYGVIFRKGPFGKSMRHNRDVNHPASVRILPGGRI